MKKYLLGVDIGTSRSKAVLVDIDGRIIAHSSSGHSISSPREGYAEHDPETIWWQEFREFCKKLIGDSGIKSILLL